MPLSEIPVSEYTASEMVRLCLRRFDADADSVDGSNSGDDEEAKQPEDNDVVKIHQSFPVASFVFVLHCCGLLPLRSFLRVLY